MVKQTYDCFEDKAEIDEMIDYLQTRCLDYDKIQQTWDFPIHSSYVTSTMKQHS